MPNQRQRLTVGANDFQCVSVLSESFEKKNKSTNAGRMIYATSSISINTSSLLEASSSNKDSWERMFSASMSVQILIFLVTWISNQWPDG